MMERTIDEDRKLPYFELTGKILNCCFEVMKELGPGFLEKVYKNALLIAMRDQTIKTIKNAQSFHHSSNYLLYRSYRYILLIVEINTEINQQ